MLERIKSKIKHNEFVWRYLTNFGPTVGYKLQSQVLNLEERRIVDALKNDGIARTTVRELFEDISSFEALVRETERVKAMRAEDIATARGKANRPDCRQGKSFKLSLLGPKPIFDPQSPFSKFALHPAIVRIVEAYLGMYARLQYFNIWINFAVDHPARSSQLWHRDRDDIHIVKGFLYLSDVEASSGPLTYARHSQRRGPQNLNPAAIVENGVLRTTNQQMMEVLPAGDVIEAVGPIGTLVFADTHGYHKGGHVREGERLLFTFMFTSPNADLPKLMTGLSDVC